MRKFPIAKNRIIRHRTDHIYDAALKLCHGWTDDIYQRIDGYLGVRREIHTVTMNQLLDIMGAEKEQLVDDLDCKLY